MLWGSREVGYFNQFFLTRSRRCKKTESHDEGAQKQIREIE